MDNVDIFHINHNSWTITCSSLFSMQLWYFYFFDNSLTSNESSSFSSIGDDFPYDKIKISFPPFDNISACKWFHSSFSMLIYNLLKKLKSLWTSTNIFSLYNFNRYTSPDCEWVIVWYLHSPCSSFSRLVQNNFPPISGFSNSSQPITYNSIS